MGSTSPTGGDDSPYPCVPARTLPLTTATAPPLARPADEAPHLAARYWPASSSGSPSTTPRPASACSVSRPAAHRDLVTAVGHAAKISAGEWITASGEWTNDRTHGLQFRVRFLKASAPSSVEGIEKYLGSGMIRGIGPVYATRLVRLFGTDVFDIIEASPARLREVEGIGPKRADRITAAWADQKRIREIMVFLHQHGVGTARAVRIFKTYGADAVQVMSENPYRLARDIRGIGFRTADLIAERLGIEKTAMIRVRAGIAFALTEAMGDGHCGLPTTELNTLAVKLLDVPEDLIASALEMELAAQTVTADSVAGTRCVFLSGLYHAERAVAGTPAPCDRADPCPGRKSTRQGAALGRGPHRLDPGRQSSRSRAPRAALEDDGDSPAVLVWARPPSSRPFCGSCRPRP